MIRTLRCLWLLYKWMLLDGLVWVVKKLNASVKKDIAELYPDA